MSACLIGFFPSTLGRHQRPTSRFRHGTNPSLSVITCISWTPGPKTDRVATVATPHTWRRTMSILGEGPFRIVRKHAVRGFAISELFSITFYSRAIVGEGSLGAIARPFFVHPEHNQNCPWAPIGRRSWEPRKSNRRRCLVE